MFVRHCGLLCLCVIADCYVCASLRVVMFVRHCGLDPQSPDMGEGITQYYLRFTKYSLNIIPKTIRNSPAKVVGKIFSPRTILMMNNEIKGDK